MATQNNTPTGWVGWGYFAGFMMMVLGGLQGIVGLTAIFRQNFYVVTQSHVIAFNITTWGWINLILGIIIAIAGYELFRGAVWARVIAVILAGLSFLANMAFISAYPIWSITIMLVDVLIIYALTVHGGELSAE